MGNKDPNQLDFFTLSFNKSFPDMLKPLAYKILDKLYFDNGGQNIKQIYFLCNNNNIDVVREIIEKLSNDYSLIKLDKSRSKRTEKRYFITEFGRKVYMEHYSNK